MQKGRGWVHETCNSCTMAVVSQLSVVFTHGMPLYHMKGTTHAENNSTADLYYDVPQTRHWTTTNTILYYAAGGE